MVFVKAQVHHSKFRYETENSITVCFKFVFGNNFTSEQLRGYRCSMGEKKATRSF